MHIMHIFKFGMLIMGLFCKLLYIGKFLFIGPEPLHTGSNIFLCKNFSIQHSLHVWQEQPYSVKKGLHIV